MLLKVRLSPLVLLFGLTSFLPSGHAQEVTGSIVGTVTDSSGASVPNATVTVTNTDQKTVLRTLTTNESGNFNSPFLPVGHYAVAIEGPGFKKYARTGLEVNVNDRVTVNATLELGAITEQVTVETSPIQVDTQTAANGTVVNGTQIRELQLSNRNFLQLITLTPGVSQNNNNDTLLIGISTPSGSVATIPISINGGRPSESAWIVDGADILDRGSNLTLTNYPSVEAIEEFRVLRGQYSAEFGRAATGQVNVITRSGKSAFHGSVYEFLRNDKLNANNYFNNLNGAARPPLRYNNFGWSLGGPVWIPKLYDGRKMKTFFFFSEEWRKQVTNATVPSVLPSANQKSGVFNTPVCIAFSAAGDCTQTGTRITNISPTAAAYIKDIFSKIPNGTGDGTPIFNIFNGKYNYRQELFKIDQIFSEKFSLSARFINDDIPTTEPGGLFTGLTVPGVATTNTNSPGRGWAVRATYAFNPTLLNEIGYTWSHGDIISTPVGLIGGTQSPDIRPKLVYPSNFGRVPGISFDTGFDGIDGFGPYFDPSHNHTFFDNLTKIIGKHNLKFGTALNWYRKSENQISNNIGGFSFNGDGGPDQSDQGVANQNWANFLLGRALSFSQAQADLNTDLRAHQYEFYVQDDWRVRPNLTINIGVRYGLYRNPVSPDKILTNFDPALYSAAKAPRVSPTTGQLIPGTGDPMNGIINGGKNSPFGDRVENGDNKAWAPRFGIAWDPFGNGKTAIRSGYGIAYDIPTVGIWQDNIGTNPPYANSVVIKNTSLDNAGSGVAAPNLSPVPLQATPLPFHQAYVQQWSFDVQREIVNGFILQVGYYGAKGTHLIGLTDLNLLRTGQLISAGLLAPGQALTSRNYNLVAAQRPYQGYGQIAAVESAFNSSYNSLQVAAQKRFGGRSQVGIAYTWAKTLTDAQSDRSSGFADPYNTRLDRAPASFSRSHDFVLNYVYDLPFFRGANGITRAVLGGWQLSGIFNAATGLPLTVTVSRATDNAGIGLGLDSGPTSSRPDRIGDPNAISNRTRFQWFNTAAFARVPTGVVRVGNSPRGVFDGPGFWRVDQSLFKNFKLGEHLNAQLRGEAFNILNHTNFAGISTNFSSSAFGRVTSVRDPRQIQLGMKLEF